MTNTPRAISSLMNDTVKFVRALDQRKERKESGQFVAEGLALLISARDAGFVPRMLLYEASSAVTGLARGLVESSLRAGVDCIEVTPAILAKIASKDNPQMMIGVFSKVLSRPPESGTLGPGDVWLALEEIRDPGNLGTIIRTVDAVGAKGIILIGQCVDPFGPDAVRATMGSIFSVPIVRMTREEFLTWRAGWSGEVVGTHLTARHDVRHGGYTGPTLVLMGSEGPGLTPTLVSACSRLVKIPMAGKLDSLNLSIATAITLFEVRRNHLSI
jgi:RNA methyltransferase, TrmH family